MNVNDILWRWVNKSTQSKNSNCGFCRHVKTIYELFKKHTMAFVSDIKSYNRVCEISSTIKGTKPTPTVSPYSDVQKVRELAVENYKGENLEKSGDD